MPTIPLRGRWILAIPFLAAPALAQVDPNSSAVTWPAHVKRPLADHDVRLRADGRPADWVNEKNAELRSAESHAARAADAAVLRASIPFLRIDDHDLFGTPHWVASTAAFLTARAPDDAFDAVEVARAFVAEHPGLFEVTADEIDFSRRRRDYSTQHNGVRHLTFQQQIGGVDLFGAEIRANVTRHGELINVSSTMLPRPEGDFQPAAVRISEIQAIGLAAQSIDAPITSEPARASRSAGRVQAWAATPDFRADMPVTTEFLYFPMTRVDIRPAWRVTLPEIGVGNTYEILVDASTGGILHRRNQLDFLVGGTQNLSLRVYTKDSPAPGSPGTATPNGFQFPNVARTLVLVTPASVPNSPNSWINDGDTDTQGNNVDAHLDLDADNVADLPRPNGGAGRVFDFPQDNAQAPTTWRPASVTNLFYFCNVYHDRLYGFGFDEASGNFQTNNFGLGGAGNDRVQADCQDGQGVNNANFGTPPDGSSGRMQQYIFTGPTPDRDSSLDSEIVYHEYSHGLSNRLHDLQVGGVQAGGMGEGWGDFFGVCLNAEPSDDPHGTYTTGGHATYLFWAGFTNNYYSGIRRFPYSTDVNKNPQTYADIDPVQQSYPPGVPRNTSIGNSADEVHNVGEVWANMLLEARANLMGTHGFAGNDLIMQLVVDGMKLDPGTPNFLQARDSILQADLVMSDGGPNNQRELWTAFAKRGCGFSASSPPGNTSAGIVEAFNAPMTFEYPNGRPTQLAPNQATTFQVVIAGIPGHVPTAGTQVLNVSINGGGFTPIAMTQTGPNQYNATLPAASCFDLLRYYVSSGTNLGPASDPLGAPGAAFAATVFTGTQTSLDDDFQADLGWTNSVAGATSGSWARGVPVNGGGWEYDPTSDGDGSGSCFLTENVDANSDVDNGSVTLTSPNFDLDGGGEVSYAYYLRLTNDDGSDRLLVEMNSSGGAGPWTTVATHTSDGGLAWRSHTISSAQIAGAGLAQTTTMKIRFTANDGGTQSIVEAGVDGFLASKVLCDDGTIGTYFCPADGTIALCPCFNQGGSMSGCDNSAGTGGAALLATGTTSPDTVVLTATGELPTALTIFLQGSQAIAAVPYGDGLRCVGGTLKRLYAHGASGGTVFAPQGADLPITVRSAAMNHPIAPGSTRFYMTYYRDQNPGFCPSQNFNGSNAVAITW